MNQSRGRVAALAVAAVALVAAVIAPLAQAATPASGYERFAGCPSPAEDPAVTTCMRSVIKGGHFQMGSKNVPIAHQITLTGGTEPNLQNFRANSEGGLAKVKQEVPGGLIGLTGLDWLVNFLNLEGLKLYAVTELVGPPVVAGTSLSLPIRVHLVNPTLGNNCYVGSASNPISLNLEVGPTNPPAPNEPITGKEAEFSFGEDGVFTLANGVLVDNSFAAPGASGCVLKLLGFIPISINGLVNAQSGLPSAAGNNETVQEIDIEIVDTSLVYP